MAAILNSAISQTPFKDVFLIYCTSLDSNYVIVAIIVALHFNMENYFRQF